MVIIAGQCIISLSCACAFLSIIVTVLHQKKTWPVFHWKWLMSLYWCNETPLYLILYWYDHLSNATMILWATTWFSWLFIYLTIFVEQSWSCLLTTTSCMLNFIKICVCKDSLVWLLWFGCTCITSNAYLEVQCKEEEDGNIWLSKTHGHVMKCGMFQIPCLWFK